MVSYDNKEHNDAHKENFDSNNNVSIEYIVNLDRKRTGCQLSGIIFKLSQKFDKIKKVPTISEKNKQEMDEITILLEELKTHVDTMKKSNVNSCI